VFSSRRHVDTPLDHHVKHVLLSAGASGRRPPPTLVVRRSDQTAHAIRWWEWGSVCVWGGGQRPRTRTHLLTTSARWGGRLILHTMMHTHAGTPGSCRTSLGSPLDSSTRTASLQQSALVTATQRASLWTSATYRMPTTASGPPTVLVKTQMHQFHLTVFEHALAKPIHRTFIAKSLSQSRDQHTRVNITSTYLMRANTHTHTHTHTRPRHSCTRFLWCCMYYQ
jgi:hypothetical protein